MKINFSNRAQRTQNFAAMERRSPTRRERVAIPRLPGQRPALQAFSLIEVMIAIGILFMGTFAILDLVSVSLANARRLQRPMVDASAVISQIAMTNKLVEGVYSGNLGELLGKPYADYKWTGEIREVS